jgi:hypothetical protein
VTSPGERYNAEARSGRAFPYDTPVSRTGDIVDLGRFAGAHDDTLAM